MSNMVFEVVGDLFLVVHRAAPPSDSEWSAYLATWKGIDMARSRTLVFTDGGGPSTIQRKRANDLLRGQESTTAVVTSSALVRGIVVSLSWFNPKIRAFSPEEGVAAFRYLSVHEPDAIAGLWRKAEDLRERLGDPGLRSIAAPRASVF